MTLFNWLQIEGSFFHEFAGSELLMFGVLPDETLGNFCYDVIGKNI